MSGAADHERLDKLRRLAQRPGTAGEGAAARAALQRLFERNPRLRASALTGLKIKLERRCDRERPCCECCGEVAPGKGPHRHALLCNQMRRTSRLALPPRRRSPARPPSRRPPLQPPNPWRWEHQAVNVNLIALRHRLRISGYSPIPCNVKSRQWTNGRSI
jgi:hypothetical protein